MEHIDKAKKSTANEPLAKEINKKLMAMAEAQMAPVEETTLKEAKKQLTGMR